VLVGLSGLYESSVNKTITMVTGNRISYTVFFAALALVGLGSGYYHMSPSNASLVWDRLPMSIAIMALVAVVIGEFLSARLGAMLLIPLMSIGVLSVLQVLNSFGMLKLLDLCIFSHWIIMVEQKINRRCNKGMVLQEISVSASG
jgi:hypothetical protein